MKKPMKKTAIAVLAITAALILAVTAAAASTGLRVIGGSRSSGDYAVTAASGSKNGAHAVYLRGYGRGLSGYAVVACSRGIASIGSKTTQVGHMSSGRLYRVRLPFPGDCQVTASLTGQGSIRLQILAS
jgi:hypothetical protein